MVRDVRDMFAVGSNNALERLWTTSNSYFNCVGNHKAQHKEPPETLIPQLEKFWNLDEA